MADDGMLVNFSLDDSLTRKTPKFKGGSWKDRMIAKKIAKFRGQKRENRGPDGQAQPQRQQNTSRADGIQNNAEYPTPRPAKRRRENGDFVASATHNVLRSNSRTQTRPPQQPSKPREVISSLFTYNPTSTTAAEPAHEPADEVPSKPSNAPLPDGIDTFTTLGLSPTLASHLLTKMELKNPTAIQKASVMQLLKEDSDAFIQSETGSGKTLAYLLPLVQRIMSFSDQNEQNSGKDAAHKILHRDSGLFAIILAPTRELCKQISVVLERVLGCAHYIVAGTVIGGEKKKSEKARLRKGLNILVATPGRLVDHLENTKVLDVGNVRWLVLDEGDRLMDLGFEEDISKIVSTLDQRQKKQSRTGLPERRTTVLCSATMKMNVQRLGEISLKDAVLIKGDAEDEDSNVDNSKRQSGSNFLAPAQLKQSYIVVAAKLRLVTLTALLRRTFARKGSVMKAIVFVSCADSVEFHFKAFTRTDKTRAKTDSSSSEPGDKDTPPPESAHDSDSICPSTFLSSSQNPLTIYKLHGSLPQPTRTAIVKAFSNATTPSLLIATDVASRGLDLPNLDLVIEYDPPFSSDDHLHRIGRTARLGRDGRATIFLLPGAEEGYVDVLKRSYKSTVEGSRAVTQMAANEVLKKGFVPTTGLVGEGGADWEQRATEFQLEVERWVLAAPANTELARRAFQSHVRAYATHVAAERGWFDIKGLHLGHLAKAFGLRDAPARMNVQGMGKRGAERRNHLREKGRRDDNGKEGERVVRPGEVDEAARKMRKKVGNRKMMMGAGADEFNIA
jgi:ATP-dependent RNA helicase DDX31/DBP7